MSTYFHSIPVIISHVRRRSPWLIAFLLLAAAPAEPKPPALELTLAQTGWGDAPRDNAEAVFRSVGQQLLPHFPGVKIEPIFVQPDGGPITLYRRNNDKQIVVKLATTETALAGESAKDLT